MTAYTCAVCGTLALPANSDLVDGERFVHRACQHRFVYWHSLHGFGWVLTDLHPTSVPALWLADHPGGIYDDGIGNRYLRDEVKS